MHSIEEVKMKISLDLILEMNREIASAPEKSEARFCGRRIAAVSRPSMEPCPHFPEWSMVRAHGAGRGSGRRRLGGLVHVH